MPSLYEDENFDFKVVKPQLHGSHIVFHVVGVDKQGTWEGTRRYNHFFHLHEALSKRWPGMLIPKIPSKKAIGNKEVKFIYERKFYLERFLRKCARFDFIVNSEEFRVFGRPGTGDIQKMLEKLPKIPSSVQIERTREVTNVNERMYDFADKERLSNIVIEFGFFSKKVVLQLKAFKKSLSNFRETKTQSIANSRVLCGLLDKYEDLNMNCYTENSPDKMVLNNPEYKQLKDSMEHMVDNQKNPFDEMYHWIKGEIYDIKAIQAAINQKDSFEKLLKRTESKKTNTQQDLENVNQSRKTLRTIFKTEKDASSMLTTIESVSTLGSITLQAEKELENLAVLIDIITIYLGEQAIPQFKKEKLKIYHKLMQQFTVMEINNAH